MTTAWEMIKARVARWNSETSALITPSGSTRVIPYLLTQKTQTSILLPSGTVNGSGLFTLGTALPYVPSGTCKVYVFAGVGLTAGLYDATFSTTTTCQLAGSPTTTAGAYAGGTSKIALATYTIPGGTIGSNGSLRVVADYFANSNANYKTPSIYLSTVAMYGAGLANWYTMRGTGIFRNKGSEALNTSGYNNSATGYGQQNIQAAGNTTIDTSQDQTLYLYGQVATASDFIALDCYSVEVLPASSTF